jgi:hypothetical protein
MPLSDAIIINMSPVVTNETRAEWEAYSVTHDDWVDETLAIQESWGKYYGPLDYNGRSFPTIHGDDDVDIEWNVT